MLKRIWRQSLLVLLVPVLLSACSVLPETQEKGVQKSEAIFTPSPVKEITPDVQHSVYGSNKLGYSLLKTLSDGKNTLISPISLSFALSMLQNGAEGETLSGILDAMGETTDEGVNARYNGLLSSLSKSGDKDDENALTVILGNSFWLRDSLTPKQAFVDDLVTYYDAEVYKADFSASETIDQINGWVEDKTNGLLKDTLKEIDDDTIAYLMNTVYFKGAWVNAYTAEATFEEQFYPSAGEPISVPMMHQTKDFGYFENDFVQIAAFPYHGEMTMKVVLPKDDIDVLLLDTPYETLRSWFDATDDEMVKLNVSMPKFEYDVTNSLSEPLKALGMQASFDSGKADFSSMIEIAGENVYVSDIFQNCKIINDEKGTEAAAVTVVEMVVTSAPIVEEEPIEFNCNKPFMYVIEDDATGAVLFMGIVHRP